VLNLLVHISSRILKVYCNFIVNGFIGFTYSNTELQRKMAVINYRKVESKCEYKTVFCTKWMP